MKKFFKTTIFSFFYMALIAFLITIGFAFYEYKSQIDTFIASSFIVFIVIIFPVLLFFLLWLYLLKK